jgi:hypothetical protein
MARDPFDNAAQGALMGIVVLAIIAILAGLLKLLQWAFPWNQ